jgi:putative nucleotidyltransferase with HDIG domain
MQRVFIDDIDQGSIIARDITDNQGRVLIARGSVFKDRFFKRLADVGVTEIFVEENENSAFENIPANVQMEEVSEKLIHIDDVIYEKTRVQAQKQVKKVMVKLRTISHISIDKINKLNKIIDDIIEQLLSKKDIVMTLSKLRSIDDYSYEHSVNVSVLSLVVGIDLNLDKESLKDLGIGAILHDIGKVVIPENILKKPMRLTAEEFEEIKKHTEYGYEILKKTNVSEEAAQIALYHHEKYDGTGYPKKLKGNNIPLFSRIVSVADVYDAISNNRVYKTKSSPDRVFKQIAQLGNKHFDAEIMEKFVSHLDLYPTGTGIILNTNHKGVVIGQNKLLPQSPFIRLFKKERKDIKDLYVDIDLSTTKHLYIKDTF